MAATSTRRPPTSTLGRVVGALLTVLVATGLLATPASAQQGRASGVGSFPTVLQLPNGFSPEGIAIDGRVAYTGSLVDGSIRRIDLRTGVARQLAPSPGPGRIAVGMDVDRFGRLWVAGGGAGFFPGVISGYRVFDTRSGAVLADVAVPDAVFLNDVFVTRDAAWFTDSFGAASLIRVPIGPRGSVGSPQKVVLGGDWTPSAGLNANGVLATPDGRHLIVG